MNSPLGYRMMLVFSALLFSTGGTAIKSTPFNGWQVASLRSAIAAAALMILLPSWRRFWRPRILLVGAAQAATMILFALANKFSAAAYVIFIQYTAPLHLLWIGPWLLKERPRRDDLILMAALMAGVLLLLVGQGPPRATASHPMAGNILAFLSGFTWAGTITGIRWLGRDRARSAESDANPADDDAGAAVVAANVMAALVALPFALPIPAAGPAAWTPVVFLGVFQIGLAYFFLTKGVRHVSALEASLILFIEPVGAAVWAWLVHGERLTPVAIAGCIVMLAATVAHSLWRMRERTAAAATQ